MGENAPFKIIKGKRISNTDLCGTSWTVKKNSEAETIVFLQGGTISGVKTSIWEAFWELCAGRTLRVFRRNGTMAYELEVTGDNPFVFMGKWKVHDSLILDVTMTATNTPPHKMVYHERNYDRLLVEQRLGNKHDFLLVTFNSLGKNFDGLTTNWEMYNLPNHFSVDYVRFSATELPRTWYTDKADRVMPVLRAAVATGYRRIVFVGMSAGGYASLVYAEKLAAEFNDCKIDTVVFNASLLVSPLHYHAFQEIDPLWRSTHLLPDDIDRKMFDPVDVDEILRRSTSPNVRHEIHYDSMNPFEVYQIEKLPELEKVKLVRHELAINHGAGTIRIYDSGKIHEAIAALLP